MALSNFPSEEPIDFDAPYLRVGNRFAGNIRTPTEDVFELIALELGSPDPNPVYVQRNHYALEFTCYGGPFLIGGCDFLAPRKPTDDYSLQVFAVDLAKSTDLRVFEDTADPPYCLIDGVENVICIARTLYFEDALDPEQSWYFTDTPYEDLDTVPAERLRIAPQDVALARKLGIGRKSRSSLPRKSNGDSGQLI